MINVKSIKEQTKQPLDYIAETKYYIEIFNKYEIKVSKNTAMFIIKGIGRLILLKMKLKRLLKRE